MATLHANAPHPCRFPLTDGAPFWSLILYQHYQPVCELSERPANLLPPSRNLTWRDLLSRWNDLSARGVRLFDREPTLDDVTYVFNQWGGETPGSVFPLVHDDREFNASEGLFRLRPQIHTATWERRIGPLSELARNVSAP